MGTVLEGAIKDPKSTESVAAIESRRLLRAAIQIHSAESVSDAIRYALDALTASGFDECMVSLVDANGKSIVGAQARGERWERVRHLTRVSVDDEDILAHVLRTGKAVFVADSRADSSCNQEHVREAGLISQYVIPLATGHRVGTLQVSIEPSAQQLDEEQQIALDAFAQHLNSSIIRIRQAEQIIQMSDVLLGNARFLIAETLAAQTVHSLGHQLTKLSGDAKRLLGKRVYRERREIREMLESWIDTFADIMAGARRTLDQIRTPKQDEQVVLTDAHSAVQQAIDRWVTFARTSGARFAHLKLDAERHHLRLPGYSLMEILGTLIVNSIQASAREISIKTESVEGYVIDDEEYLPHALLVYVADDGRGLSAEAKSNVELVFSPAYSTKAKDVGTGLGLFVARKIARSGGGELYYDGTERGARGARFKLVLPTAPTEE